MLGVLLCNLGFISVMKSDKKLIVVVGPTAVGKTNLAIQLALHYNTEIISADSRQIYRELEIGTAKPTPDELALVKHHLINSHSINENYDAGAYGREALALIHSLFEKYDTVILCGGSGLYVKAVLEGFDDMPDIPPGIREEINQQYKAHGLIWLQQQVQATDPDYFAEVDVQNPHRLIRALELYRTMNKPVGELRKKKKIKHPFSIVKIGLEVDRTELYHRINTRMDAMITAGLFEEAQKFFPHRALNALQTVGYREIFEYLEGKYDREEAIRLLKRNTRQYAKRQLTWFRKDKEVSWFNPNQVEAIVKLIDRNGSVSMT